MISDPGFEAFYFERGLKARIKVQARKSSFKTSETMKSIKLLILSAIAISAVSLTTQGDDEKKMMEILKKHFNAMGYEKMEKFETIIMKGKVDRGGMKMPFKLIKKRPGKIRQEFKFQSDKYVTAYDGKEGWTIRPGMSASKKAQDLTGERLKRLKDRTSFEDQLYHYKEKGYEVEYEGEEKMEGTPVYHIKLIKDDKETVHYYIGKGNYVLLKRKTKSTNEEGKEQSFELVYSNYKKKKGIPFSYVQEMGSGGNGQSSKIVIEEIEIGKKVPDSKFERPTGKKKKGED